MVLSSWQSRCESSPGSFDECRLSAKVAANPQTKPTDSDWESASKKWQLPSTCTIAILLLLIPRADTHFTVPRRVEGWVDLGTAVRVYSLCPRLYIAVAVVINNCPRWDSNLGPLTLQSGILPLGHCDTVKLCIFCYIILDCTCPSGLCHFDYCYLVLLHLVSIWIT